MYLKTNIVITNTCRGSFRGASTNIVITNTCRGSFRVASTKFTYNLFPTLIQDFYFPTFVRGKTNKIKKTHPGVKEQY